MDHGMLSKGDLYEGGIRGALFARFPAKAHAGLRIAARVSNVDLAATLIAYANIDAAALRSDGTSWLPLVSGKAVDSSSYMAEINNDRALVSTVGLQRMKLIMKCKSCAQKSSQKSAKEARALLRQHPNF